ncbi:hypothetical protein M513_14054, partial [Trichuris suis]
MKKRTLNSMISSLSKPDRDGLAALYEFPLLIAKAAEVLETVLHQNARDVTRNIPLSNDTVQRRIDAMAEDTEETLCCVLRQREFSLQLETNHFYWPTRTVVEESLFSKELSTDRRERNSRGNRLCTGYAQLSAGFRIVSK